MASEKSIQTMTLKELFASTTDGTFPILIDIQSDQIVWNYSGNESDYRHRQENHHLRLINSNAAVVCNGYLYEPAVFTCEMPSEDGSKVGNMSITISAIDQRIIEIIRSITSKPSAFIDSFFTKISDSQYIFSKMYHYEFQMTSVTWDNVTAKWNLVFDPSMQVNVPRDTGTALRCPAIYQDNL